MTPLPLLLLAAASAAPRGFDRFWRDTRAELAQVPLSPSLIPDPAHSDADVACFKASYASLGGGVVHARYCRPAGQGPFPAVLISPWYGEGEVRPPRELALDGVAALWYQARGFEVDLASYPAANSWYVLSGIDRPETYVYREIVSHALRGLDFLAARPEVDAKRIAAMGASQGGGLSLLVAGLDARVSAVAADFPFLSDWETSLLVAGPPYADVEKYIGEHPDRRAAVLKTVSYFDALDVAERIEVPALVNVGLRDQTCPPDGVKAVYRRIPSRRKKLVQYDADHGDKNAERWQGMVDFLVADLLGR